MNEDFSRKSKLQDLGRWYVTRFVEEISNKIPKGSSVLDAGAGECVYKKYFAHCEYKSIDLAVGESKWDYSHLDYVGPLHEMPIPDNTFDVVLCTQVLEHLEWPRESVREMHRVLKKGGRLCITVPFGQPEHQTPYDFFRYTSFGLRSICEKAGFEQVEVRPFGGIFMRWAYQLPELIAITPRSGLKKGPISLKGIALLPLTLLLLVIVNWLQPLLVFIDRFDKKKSGTLGWSCVAYKD